MTDRRTETCESCPVADAMARRDFIRDAVSGVVAGLAATGVAPQALRALPVGFVSGSGAGSARLYPIPSGDGVAIDKDESVIVARFESRVYAFSLACPHQNTALRWDAKAQRFQCPKHNSRYRPNGVFIEGRATRGLDRFAVKRERNQLSVDFDRLYREDKQAAEWMAAFVDLAAEK